MAMAVYAFEAGYTDADTDGQVDEQDLTQTEQAGSDGYGTPADTDSSGTADFLESGVATCALDLDMVFQMKPT